MTTQSQLRSVSLKGTGDPEVNTTKMMSSGQVKDYEEDKKEMIDQINRIADLLTTHNQKVEKVVDSYKKRTGQ